MSAESWASDRPPTPALGDGINQHDAVLAGSFLGCTPEQRIRAMRYVASACRDADDCELLLSSLGLIEQRS